MNILEIRNMLVSKLYAYLGNVPIIPSNSNKPRPPYPFITYHFITSYDRGFGAGSVTKSYPKSKDERFEVDIKETVAYQPTFTISYTVISLDNMESNMLAQKVSDYFQHKIYYDLKDHNIIVQDISNIGHRSSFIVDDYECKYGFDIKFRTTQEIERLIETIEKYPVGYTIHKY